MITIQSAANGIIKHIKKLSGNAYREKCGEVLLEGERLVLDSASFGAELITVLLREGYAGRVPKAEYTYYVSPSLFDAVAETETPQGIMAIAKTPIAPLESIPKGGLVVVCDRIQDPGNLGTIYRLCHAVGADGLVLLKGTVHATSSKVLRASMGAVFSVPAAVCDTLPAFSGYTSFAAALTADAEDLYSVSFPKKTMLVIGNEGEGVCESVLKASDKKIVIPMPGGAESLNAAVAGAVVSYEYLRQVNYVR